jgi:type II secretory pathway pseudopilin PulG
MYRITTRLTALTAGLLVALPLPAQQPPQPPPPPPSGAFRVNPNPAAGALPSQTQAGTRPTNIVAPNITVAPGGYGGYPGYYPGGYPYYPYGPGSRAAGYLYGVAAVTDANAQYQLTIQQARQEREQVTQQQLQTRGQIIQEMQYEKQFLPDAQKTADEDAAKKLYRARNNPSNSEIWSGDTLNLLLADIRKMETGSGLRGPSIPLDENVLKHINVTTGTTYGSVALVKQGAKQQWPLPLYKDRFKSYREAIEKLMPEVLSGAMGSGINPQALQSLIDAINDLKKVIQDSVADLTPTEYVKAMRYANQLSDSVKNLEDPNVRMYLNGTWAAKGNSVGELIAYMNQNGALKFAPATPGDEPYYSTLYQALLGYDLGMYRLVAR